MSGRLGVQVKVQKLRIFTFYTMNQHLLGPTVTKYWYYIQTAARSPMRIYNHLTSRLYRVSPESPLTKRVRFVWSGKTDESISWSNELSGRLRIISKSHWTPSREWTYPPDFRHIWVDDFPNFPRWDMFSFPGGYIESMFHPFFPPPVMELVNDGCKCTITISLGTIPRWRKHRPGSSGFRHSHNLGGGFKYFLFSPLLGEMIQFD